MKSRTVRGSAFFMPPANNALANFAPATIRQSNYRTQPTQSGSTARRDKGLEPACLPRALPHMPAYLNPINISTSPAPHQTAHSLTDFLTPLSNCCPAPAGQIIGPTIFIFSPCSSSEPHPTGIHNFFCSPPTNPTLLSAISAPVASILTQ